MRTNADTDIAALDDQWRQYRSNFPQGKRAKEDCGRKPIIQQPIWAINLCFERRLQSALRAWTRRIGAPALHLTR